MTRWLRRFGVVVEGDRAAAGDLAAGEDIISA